MTYKAHATIATGMATMLMHSNDIKYMIGGSILAIAGALIVDIDSANSKASSYFRTMLSYGVVIVVLNIILKLYIGIDIFNNVLQNNEIKHLVIPVALLLILLVIGSRTKHRKVVHSFLFLVIYTIPIYMLVGPLYVWFSVGYLTHILVDLLNEKEERLFFPLKKGFCFGLCKSNGIVDFSLFAIFLFITLIQYKEMIMNLIKL